MTDTTTPTTTPTMSSDTVSGKTVMFIFYLLYKSNLITRNHLTRIFEEIKKPQPEDITKYLVAEEAKRSK